MSRGEWALVAAGLVGFGLTGLGRYVVGQRWLTLAGVLLAGVATVWLVVIQQGMTRRGREAAEGSDGWVVWIFAGTMIVLGIIALLFRAGILN
jgi:hypothetical protein